MRTAAEHDPKEASVDTQEEAIETKSSACISDQRTVESGNLSSESKDCDINTSPKTEKGCDQEEQENPVSTAPGTCHLYIYKQGQTVNKTARIKEREMQTYRTGLTDKNRQID